MAYTTIDDPSAFFQTALYTSTGSALNVVNTGNSDLQPDLIWIKSRSEGQLHCLFNSSHTGEFLSSNLTAASDTSAGGVTSYNTDGFSIGTLGGINNGTNTHVAWQWKAGTSFSNDASSTSVGSIDSAGSVNTDAGFSIITYTGTGTAGTIAHGLGKLPKMIIAKQRNATENWVVYFLDTSIAYNNVNNYLELDTNIASTGDSGGRWGSYGNYSTTTFGVGADDGTNKSSSTYVAYVFSDIQGYSKIGKYTGNGNADGSYVHLGFKPAFIMIKVTSTTSNWGMFDNKRLGFNPKNEFVRANETNTESSDYDGIDFLSNGFKLRTTSTLVNAAQSYIYLAFAENPFTTSTGVPGTAR
jgi:hypothetical protein